MPILDWYLKSTYANPIDVLESLSYKYKGYKKETCFLYNENQTVSSSSDTIFLVDCRYIIMFDNILTL